MTTNYPRFVVLLAAFNGVPYLAEQLDSILAQTNVLVSVIISVDRSMDGTEEWADQRARMDKRITTLTHGVQFGGAAPNFFRMIREIDFSEYDYVSFSDQDDIWLPNKLIRSHEILLETNSDAYSSNVMAVWPNGRRILVKKSQPQVRWDFLFESAGPGCTFVIKKLFAKSIQFYIKKNLNKIEQVDKGQHDWFIYAFARANGYRWVIDEYAGMLYRQHEKNLVGVNSGWAAFLYRARRVLSGWGLSQSLLIAKLIGLNDDPFVTRWSQGGRGGMLFLAIQARQCRRLLIDQIIFAIACVILSVVGRNKR